MTVRPRPTTVAAGVLAAGLAAAWMAAAGPGSLAPEKAVHLVSFPEASLASYRGEIDGLEATNPEVRGERRLDPRNAASRAYLAYLDRQQAEHIAAVERAIGRPLEVIFSYRAAGNGIATRLTAAEAELAARVPGVERVARDRDRELLTDRGPVFIGAEAIWSGNGGGPATHGEGVVVGVIDTGVNLDHPSFSDQPIDGHVYTNPLGDGQHVGWCDPGNPNYDPVFVCNEKLIGAWDFADAVSVDDDGPEDSDGHGSHTASTVAGNFIDIYGDGVPDLSGVAPHANLITYDACYVDPISGQGLCPDSATFASVDQAILDGVVGAINYSISGGTNPWSDSDIDSFFLDAVAAGIFVAASAGNGGPGAGTVNHLGPWTATIAASTHDRVAWENSLSGMSGGDDPPADISGESRTVGYGPASIVYAGNYDNGDPTPEQCLAPFPAGTWSGEIVVCDRGTIARVLKGQHVLVGGAGGMMLANVPGSSDLVDDPHILPAIHVDQAAGDAVKAWLASGSGHTATITGASMVLDPATGDVMASFSSRGPNNSFDVLKPDVTNPGVNVIAATRTGLFDTPGLPPYVGPEFFFLSGTSMSSPHTAGSAALVAALHPDWSPPEIKAALMTTAWQGVVKEDGVTPAGAFDFGAGRVDLSMAGLAGLVLDETDANFRAADPSLGGDPRTLNLASLADSDCSARCSWTRIVEGSADSPVAWTAVTEGPDWMSFVITPASFTLAPGGTQEIGIEIRVGPGAPLGEWAFGAVTLMPDGGVAPPARLPAAIIPTEGCVLALSLGERQVRPGDLLPWTVRVLHRRLDPVDASFRLWIEDAQGDVVASHRTGSYTFRYLDHTRAEGAVQVPAGQAAGAYSLVVAIGSMEQGVVRRAAEFTVVGPADAGSALQPQRE